MINQSKQKIGDLDCVIIRDSRCHSPRAAIVLCHGFGAPSTDLVSLGSEFVSLGGSLAEVVYLFPAAPISLDPSFDSRAWWMIDMERMQQLMLEGKTREMRGTSPEDLPKRRASLNRVLDFCQSEYSLPASQIVIGGFSQGAMVSTDVALHFDQRLGGLIVWSGSLINESKWAPLAKKGTNLKVVQSHGKFDPILPLIGAESLRDMLMGAGHSVRFCEFNGQHEIPLQSIELSVQLINEVASQAKAAD